MGRSSETGLRAASADSGEALANSYRQRGWADAERGTDPCHKAPLLRQAAALEWREDAGEPLDEEGRERVLAGAPAGPGTRGAGVRGDPARRGRGAAVAGTGLHGDSGEPEPVAAGGASRGHLRWDGLLHAESRTEPG